ncbi:hypothetical protein [Bacillus alkalicellulosilyticus]|nr:hypothetical protein [Bacillus alkalicellulosilyticus]
MLNQNQRNNLLQSFGNSEKNRHGYSLVYSIQHNCNHKTSLLLDNRYNF